MGTDSPSPQPVSPSPSRTATGAILFSLTFICLTAVIFTVCIKPKIKPTDHASSVPSLPLTYPPSRAVDVTDTYFETKVPDPYRWLEDGKAQEVKDWTGAQNNLARTFLDTLPGRAALEKRFKQLFYVDTISAPDRSGDRFFYMKRKATDEKSILYWRPVDKPDEEHVLIDPNQFIGKSNAALGGWVPTYDGKLLAYTLKPNNADESTLYIKNVETGEDLKDVIEGAKYASPSWVPDGSGFVYTYLPPAEAGHVEDRPGLAVIRYHKLGTDPKNDPVIHKKTGDATQFIGCSIARDGKQIFFEQGNWASNELWYQDLYGQPTARMMENWDPIVRGKPFLYSLQAWKGQAYITTNEEASRYRLFKVSLENPHRDKWHEIIPEDPNIVLEGVAIVGERLVVSQMENVTSRLDIRDLDGKPVRRIDLPGLGSLAQLAGEPDHPELYYGFVNFTTPLEIYKTSVTDPAQVLWAKINVPVDPSPYVVEQKFFVSKDETRVPMFIVHRKDILLDGSTPFLLTGYGGFGVNQSPFFWPGSYPWLEAGGGYAVVNLRGGGEFGEQWHQNGMLLKKQNVFDDCAAAAEYLVSHGYTKSSRLAIRGGSNGGLLVGAMITQRPELFHAAICEVPLLDMLRFDQFSSGKTWTPEYGSPKDSAQFAALYAYSPYHHVVPGTKYPAVLFCSSADDDRVDPMHARKMAAELQIATASNDPILLRIEAESGHGGGDQVKKSIALGTDLWSFLIYELGAKVPGEASNQ